jgi:23S rRNA (uracil1939-C5)-methyltransferase
MGAKGKSIAWIERQPSEQQSSEQPVPEQQMIVVDRGLPGDVVDLQVTRRRKTHLEAKVVKIHQVSEQRVEPFCQHFGACGGCKWQDLPYSDQLHYKQKAVWTALESVQQRTPFEFRDILASPLTYHYRNKLEFTFSNRRWLTQAEIESGQRFDRHNALGFHAPGRFDKVIDIETCYLQPDPSNAIRRSLRSFALEHQLEFYDAKAHQGLLRTLMIRTSSTGEIMVVVVFHANDRSAIQAVMQHLADTFPQITALLYTINPKLNDTLSDLDMLTWRGQDFITERLGDLKFRIGAQSFFQTNTIQALKLYQQVLQLAGLTGQETVYDLYTGTGTIANFVAHQSAKVVGIEYVAAAIEDAQENSRLNGIHNTRFFAGDIKEVLNPEFVEREGKPDVLITDPPRAGMHPDVVQSILSAQPDRIVYVSCNPQTQAIDLQLLQRQYQVQVVQPVDMFPHTYHVETIALLQRISPHIMSG